MAISRTGIDADASGALAPASAGRRAFAVARRALSSDRWRARHKESPGRAGAFKVAIWRNL